MKRILFFLFLVLGLRAPLTIEPAYSLTAFAYSISTLCSDKEWSGCIEDCPCDIDVIISKDTVKIMSQEPGMIIFQHIDGSTQHLVKREVNNEKGIPVFLCGMTSGQRALDSGRREELIAQVAKVI